LFADAKLNATKAIVAEQMTKALPLLLERIDLYEVGVAEGQAALIAWQEMTTG